MISPGEGNAECSLRSIATMKCGPILVRCFINYRYRLIEKDLDRLTNVGVCMSWAVWLKECLGLARSSLVSATRFG